MLKENGIETTWKNISELYRYDKRLLFNAFRYISFEEEYLRARAVYSSENPEKEYGELQEKSLNDLIIELKRLDLIGDDETQNLMNIKALRNAVSHNRIILEEKDAEGEFVSLYKALPENYKSGFANDVCKCTSNLNVPEKLIISIAHNCDNQA